MPPSFPKLNFVESYENDSLHFTGNNFSHKTKISSRCFIRLVLKQQLTGGKMLFKKTIAFCHCKQK